MKTCPHCNKEISYTAKKCKHCGEWITNDKRIKSKAGVSDKELLGIILSIITCSFMYFGITHWYGNENGNENGYNTIKYTDGDRYEGNFVNGQKEGKGTYYWIDGYKYEGDWKNDKREGKGTFYGIDGSKYEGDWKNDKREGYGKYYGTNGYKYEGYYKNNLADGDSIEYREDGRRFEGIHKVGYRYNGKVLDNYGKQVGYVKNGIFYNNDGSYIQTFYKFDKDPEGLLRQ